MHYQPKQDLLNDRIILVTGASDGIGREAAMTYARYGATVILLGRNEKKIIRAWMVFCIMPDCSAMFAQ